MTKHLSINRFYFSNILHLKEIIEYFIYFVQLTHYLIVSQIKSSNIKWYSIKIIV